MAASPIVSISCGASSAALAISLQALLLARKLEVVLDSPTELNSLDAWGVDQAEVVDSAFDVEVQYCILLLDRSYLNDKWFRYRRAKLLDIIFKRRGFVLPVQVGDEPIDIHGLTHHLGKIKVDKGDANTISDYFIQKFSEAEKHAEGALERTLDFSRVLELYNNNLVLERIEHHVDKPGRVGFEFFRTNDAVTTLSTNFILFYEGVALQATIDDIHRKHAQLIIKGTTVVIIPKERDQVRLEARLNNVKSIFDKTTGKNVNAFYLDEFVWRHCTPAALHANDPPFAIRGFVEPSIDTPDGSGAVSFVKDWYANHPTPILLIRGSGGIGKTTLAQAFSNYLIQQQFKKVIFIDDDTICDYFLRSADDFSEGFSIYDAYRALIAKSEARTHPMLSEEGFMLNFDSGNIFLIIDGLDQVIARLGNRFKASEFLSSLYTTDSSQRRKIIITCRSAFLPESYFSLQITAVDVLPFDNKQAESFLNTRFPSLPKIVDKGLSLASSLTHDNTSRHFFPFLLDIVANLMQGQLQGTDAIDWDEEGDRLPLSSGLLSDSNDNDYIIYRVCAREHRKYPNSFSVDQQIRCFLSLAVRHRGAVEHQGSAYICDACLRISGRRDASQGASGAPPTYRRRFTDVRV